MAQLPATTGRARLKVEPIDTDENLFAQLVASTARIEEGIDAIRDLLEQLMDDDDPAPPVDPLAFP